MYIVHGLKLWHNLYNIDKTCDKFIHPYVLDFIYSIISTWVLMSAFIAIPLYYI